MRWRHNRLQSLHAEDRLDRRARSASTTADELASDLQRAHDVLCRCSKSTRRWIGMIAWRMVLRHFQLWIYSHQIQSTLLASFISSIKRDNESRDGDGEKAFYSTKMNVSHHYPYVCIMQQFQHASKWWVQVARVLSTLRNQRCVYQSLGFGYEVEFQSFETRLMEVDGDTGGIDEGI